jgi:hemolysin D
MKDHHDFRPILAEIEEHPPNPLGTYFLWTIVALMLVVLLGLYFIKVDVVVTARGKIIPFGDVKVLQPLETGVITGIHVREGDFVKEEDILLEIDPSVDTADMEGKSRNLEFSRLAMERVNAVLAERSFHPSGKGFPQEAVNMQLAQYRAQRDVYSSTLKEKENALREARSELNTFMKEIDRLKDLLSMTKEDEKRFKSLVEVGALAENRYREKMKERMNLERELEVKEGQAAQTEAKIARIENETETFRNGFREKLLAEYSDSLQGKNMLEAEVSSLRFKKEKRFITSPVNGYVYLLPVKTLGGVVTTAQPVVGIVPEKTPLIVNALVFNKDIGFVKKDQDCVIKVDTFDFQKYGTIKGKVKTISPFNLDEQDKNQPKTEGEQPGGYPLHINMFSEELKTKNGMVYPVKPGMTVTAEINVGKRRVLEFFLFPVIKYLDEGLKVR